MSTDKRTRAWVDVSASALRENLQTLREAAGEGVRLIPMVKADAYGLGVGEVVSTLEPLDPWGYGVAAVEEGIFLRNLGVEKPILVCSPIPPISYGEAVEGRLILSISDLEGLALLREAVSRVGIPASFHLEVDTGMGRAGFDRHRVEEWMPKVESIRSDDMIWEGCFTHFHSADSADEGPTSVQWERLQEIVGEIPCKPDGFLVHACNSPGVLRKRDFAADAVRPGIFLYGGVAGDALPPPAPVASLRARIVFLRDALPGSTAGYGSTYTAPSHQRWATVGIGYGDGLPRLLSNRGEALVRGRRVPIIGRISMDVTVLDVTEAPDVSVGDVVTFFGRADGAEILLEEVAQHARTINYEILTGLTRRLPRIWTDDGGY